MRGSYEFAGPAFKGENQVTDRSKISLAAEIVSAYVSRNAVSSTDLPALLRSVHDALAAIETGAKPVVPIVLVPAVEIKKSITKNHIVCLDDGKTFRSLRRHLTALGMTPEQYRAKWSLPHDYPMVAPAYSAHRSVLAKKIRLGRNGVAR